MTTTLRPTEPLQRTAEGNRSRRFAVCVNSRPVGTLHLATHPAFGPSVAQILDLRIDEQDRGRGRGTVAALAAEEVARGWNCRRLEASVPAEQTALLRLAGALGYVERNRNMAKPLPRQPPALPPGSVGRRMTEAEYGPWLTREKARYERTVVERGATEREAREKSERDHAALLPDGIGTPDVLISVLEHEGETVGTLWVAGRSAGFDGAYIYDVEVAAEHRGRGHGRSLMLYAETDAIAAGATRIGLNVFADNTPALRLYESLGYTPTRHHLYKQLL
ncbi:MULTISPECIES: GNAT family N-acetyltransferase [unclassified Streptomyces]|uniref:GNAT family N-acetyltransferase n=1 Tax=unclassified Streptomyces TaxID=2593676 RepID=UPI000DB99AE1|nr:MULTISPECIES: GNAT family N-acetyltransferase [unclassified Streptomyces]MYT69393.1 GNAT family N-acetyltransferase [Streptomyces sp. SID8367]RAJ79779.1 GNAT family acetyltransferase [Streptomyces sp. PsTaAH-137]